MNQDQKQDISDPSFDGADTSISLEEAQEKVNAFRERILGLPDWPEDISRTKACHITRTDIEEMLGEGDIDGIRCYLALRNDIELEKQVISLVMVGTRLLADGTYEDVILNAEGEPATFDFTMPCPKTCDPDSPLN
jgi:hypothetical protein